MQVQRLVWQEVQQAEHEASEVQKVMEQCLLSIERQNTPRNSLSNLVCCSLIHLPVQQVKAATAQAASKLHPATASAPDLNDSKGEPLEHELD